mmetsp:Transcript_114425/g.356351  ORF Transcript_114425/g.356351 Transcript_114425/m.356351 type:complete len:219 (+) Transcript_114425:427-1083(+)
MEVDGQQAAQDVRLCQRPGVVGRVAADLAQGPSGSCFQVILRLVDEGVLEWGDALRYHNRQGQGLRESRDVAECHDAGQAVVAPGLGDVVHHGGHSASIHDEFCQVRRVPGNLADASGSVLADKLVDILEAMQDLREDLRLHDDLCQVHRVFRNLREARADLPLERGVAVRNVLREERNRAGIHNGLRKLRAVFADVAERGGRDPLESELRLLEAEHQ